MDLSIGLRLPVLDINQILNLTALLFTYFSRTALPALHFNEYLRRESQQSKDGMVYTKSVLPKVATN